MITKIWNFIFNTFSALCLKGTTDLGDNKEFRGVHQVCRVIESRIIGSLLYIRPVQPYSTQGRTSADGKQWRAPIII